VRPKGFLAGVRYDQTMKKKIALWLRENQCSDLLITMKEKKTTRLFMKRKGLQNNKFNNARLQNYVSKYNKPS